MNNALVKHGLEDLFYGACYGFLKNGFWYFLDRRHGMLWAQVSEIKVEGWRSETLSDRESRWGFGVGSGCDQISWIGHGFSDGISGTLPVKGRGTAEIGVVVLRQP